MDRESETRDTGFATGGTPGEMGLEDSGQSAMEKARDKARDLAADAKDTASDRLETRKHRAADTLTTVARSLRRSGEDMYGEEASIGQYMRQMADQVERFAGYLESRDMSEMMDQVEDFARRQPAAFVGGAFTLGMIGARFLKSSRDRLYREESRRYRDDRRLPESMDDFNRGYQTSGTFAQPMGSATSRPQSPGATTRGYETETTNEFGYAASGEPRDPFDQPPTSDDDFGRR